MKKIEKIAGNERFTAVEIGTLDEIAQHSLIHPRTGETIEGKVFLKDITNATGTEISFNSLPPHAELSYFHIHSRNEETYIFLRGSGDFQVDDESFPVAEGSVIRIAPSAVRGLRNASHEPLIYMVIQSTEGSLGQYSMGDGTRVQQEKKWK